MRPGEYGQDEAEQHSGQKTDPECLILGQARLLPVLCSRQIRLTVLTASGSGYNGLKTKGTLLELLGYRHESTMMESAQNINQKDAAIR